jgi:hypothetical protein
VWVTTLSNDAIDRCFEANLTSPHSNSLELSLDPDCGRISSLGISAVNQLRQSVPSCPAEVPMFMATSNRKY